jgi:cyclophilin family peptidyl-prolyl cis-trans isomerase
LKFSKILLLLTIFFIFIGCTPKEDTVIMETNYGIIKIKVDYDNAPKHAANFIKLVKNKFYDGLQFHRVIPGFMIRGGDPLSKDDDISNDGTGGPGYMIPAEIKAIHTRGSLAAARMGDQVNPERKSNGSQFYICLLDLTQLDGQYTVFGKVISGMETVDKIAEVKTNRRDHPLTPVIIKKAYVK